MIGLLYNRKRNIIALIMALLANVFFTVLLYSQEIRATVEITGVTIGGGDVYVAIFSNERDYKEDRLFDGLILEATQTILIQELDLSSGEYVISSWQDTNGNGKLDKNLFGIPTESFGITNYSRGRPGNFHLLKVIVNSSQTRVTVNIGRFRL